MNQKQLQLQRRLSTIKRRLIEYLQYHFQHVGQMAMHAAKRHVVTFNESLFQQWQQLLGKMIIIKQDKQNKAKPITQLFKPQKSPPIPSITTITITKALKLPSQNTKFILNLQPDTVNLYDIYPKGKQAHLRKYQHNRLSFNKDLIKKFSTYNFIDEYNAILIGGSLQGMPNRKSKDIIRLNLANNEVYKIAELNQGISSHSTCKILQFIYVIGGNKDFNTVTKCCIKYDITSQQVTRISPLNYPSASHTTIPWKNSFIYKIGGIGSCFGSFDLSPYIERYSLEEDEWEIINPIIKLHQIMLDYYSLMVNSLAFFNSQNSIVILGGFDINFDGSNKMFEMSIREEQDQNGETKHVHEISKLGMVDALQKGGFLQQQYINDPHNQIIAVQTIHKQGQGHTRHKVVNKVVNICQSITYL